MLFIPPHLAEEVIETSEIISLRDEFGHQRLREGKYTPGQIDAKWTPEIEKDFANWMKTEKKNSITPEQREKYLKGRAGERGIQYIFSQRSQREKESDKVSK